MNNVNCLSFIMDSQSRLAWNFILQKGVHLTALSGMTVRQFLVEVLGYDHCFIDETVRTVFLNSSPVDDIDTAFVKDGDKVALGSAMPGLVGICMGRDNPYKEFRSGIACSEDDGGETAEQAISVFIKIFSTLAVETGEDVLGRGIGMKANELMDFMGKQKAHLVEGELVDIPSDSDAIVRIVVTFQK